MGIARSLALTLAATATLTSPLAAATKIASGSAAKVGAKVKAPLAPVKHSVLPFIDDDYPRALVEARASKKPIFIEAWAPW